MSILEEIIFAIGAGILSIAMLTVIFRFINAFAVWSASKMLKETDPEYLVKHPALISALFDGLPGGNKRKK